jgi:hypothetical protein
MTKKKQLKIPKIKSQTTTICDTCERECLPTLTFTTLGLKKISYCFTCARVILDALNTIAKLKIRINDVN